MLVEFIISYGTNQTDYGSNFVFDLLCGSVYYYVLNLNGYIYHPQLQVITYNSLLGSVKSQHKPKPVSIKTRFLSSQQWPPLLLSFTNRTATTIASPPKHHNPAFSKSRSPLTIPSSELLLTTTHLNRNTQTEVAAAVAST